MTTASTFCFQEKALLWALGLSFVAHALLVMALHPFQIKTAPNKDPLIIEFQRVEKKPEPPPPPPPEPVKPKLPPKSTLKPPPTKPLPEPPPVKQPELAPVQPRLEAPPPPPAVIAVAPKEEATPAFVAPPPPIEPPKPVGPSAQDMEAARHGYGSLLAREIGKHKQYPRLAAARGWQGTVRIQLDLDASGTLISSRVSESSGHEVLDQQALEMVQKVSPLPLPPDILRNKPLTIVVPVPFRLE